MSIFKKEEKVAELALEYLEACTTCVTTAKTAVDAYLDGDVAAARDGRNEVRQLEAEADRLRRAIGDELHSGAYMPLIRGDIYSLVEAFDRVPNAAEACATFFTSQKPSIPEEYTDAFRQLLADSLGSMKPLAEAVRTFFDPKGQTDEVRSLTGEVSIEESKVDEQEWALTNSVFDSAHELAHKLHLRAAIRRIVHISDRAEDAADQLGLVAVKAVT